MHCRFFNSPLTVTTRQPNIAVSRRLQSICKWDTHDSDWHAFTLPYASHLTAFIALDSSIYTLVTSVQLITADDALYQLNTSLHSGWLIVTHKLWIDQPQVHWCCLLKATVSSSYKKDLIISHTLLSLQCMCLNLPGLPTLFLYTANNQKLEAETA